MTESERLQKLEAVQMELFTVAAQQEQLRLNFRSLERERKKLTAKIIQLRSVVKRLQPIEMKKCRKCRVEMRIDLFYEDRRYADNHDPYCKCCRADLRKAWKKVA